MFGSPLVRSCVFSSVFVLCVVLAGCAPGGSDTSTPRITDPAFLTDSLWNDGQAEVAFYRVERSENQYGRPEEQQFLVGTYLVKHTFDRAAMSKAGENPEAPVSSFKYAQFYELESGSYQYKRSYVVNARQRDLQPLKASFTSFDWCSNQYRETAFPEDDHAGWLMRSDDYRNEQMQFAAEGQAYPSAQVPLLIRALDFDTADRHQFRVLSGPGSWVRAEAELAGSDSVATAAGTFWAERVIVRYEASAPSTVGETTARQETYWRTTGPERHLVKLTAESGRYGMELIEVLRSPYWNENIYDRLQRVAERP